MVTKLARFQDAYELEGYWGHNAGYARLGEMAYRHEFTDLVVHNLEKLERSYRHYHRSETMGLLAKTYASLGRRDDGVALLVECLERLDEDARSAIGSDVELFASWRQNHVSALRELAPDHPAAKKR